ncbi:NYN domain-containing protein [Mumia sp. DW29H23]|uniref:NYN domain-containing protein n=1 Tax=Mumia sp. DW29H23 TaxID=3421241 RepID=UPI003D682B57
MAEPGDTRVAVYLDFDNIVISRYDQVNGRNQFQRDKARAFSTAEHTADDEVIEKLARATVDVGAIIDFASSFGTLVLTRAYADWSAPVNAEYRGQLVSRAVDLVQLFPAAAYGKNGADIRLAVDAVEDMFRLPDLTHVVIVAGDSDYIALAQRCKRLGRYVVGVGVAGSTSKSLAAACDEMVTYDALPGVEPPPPASAATEKPAKATRKRTAKSTQPAPSEAATADEESAASPAKKAARKAPARSTVPVFAEPGADDVGEPEPEDAQEGATRLLERALRLGHEKDDADWLHSSAVKSQMKRMDPSFNEKALGYRSFSDFVKSRDAVAEMDDSSTARLVRLRPGRGRR